jgi:putative cardiolipin synthase
MSRPDVSNYKRPVSYAITANNDSLLSQTLEQEVKKHPGESGFMLISNGENALLMRISLLNAAEKAIDIQYYSFLDDLSGKLLLEAILRAADRGVRIRILVDDINLKKSDNIWSLLNTHPNIEMRVFNPFATKDQGILSRLNNLFEFERFTKRMHNKVFIADNQLSIIGGRNLGDAYFDNNEEFNFRDVDILAAGPITTEVSKSFDKYWNGNQSYPLASVQSSETGKYAVSFMREMLRDNWKTEVEKGKLAHLQPMVGQLKNGDLPLTWAAAELAVDPPAKITQPREASVSRPGSRLKKLVENAKSEFLAITPYFIPSDDGVTWLKSVTGRGVKVKILTNSLASTDVVAVHTGYKRYRKQVIEDGVELYEMKPIPGKHPRTGRFARSKRASLHTKIYVIDRKDVIIGTFNFDPRSIELNTEIAFVIHSPALAEQILKMFEKGISPDYSYHLELAGDNELEWITRKDGREIRYTSEPEAGFWRNVKAIVLSVFPLEDQL